MRKQHWVSIILEDNGWLAKGTLLKFERGCWMFRFTRMWSERGNELCLLERVMVGMLLRHWTFWVRDRSSNNSFSQLLIKAPMGRFFLQKIAQGVAYEKLKFKDGINMEVKANLSFINFNWHGLNNHTTFEDESWQTFKKLVGRD